MVRVSREGSLPLSFAQQRLWFLHQLEPELIAFNIPLVVHLRGWLDGGVLVRALEEIVRRHEVLRTTFAAVEGEARQHIGEAGGAGGVVVAVEDLSQEEEREREQRVQEMAEQEATTPFDLGRGPLLRVRLLRMGREEHRLLFTMHHIITDGWSMGILVREFVALYRAYAKGEGTPLAELELQYADFAAWQREHQGQRQERDLEYWRGQLAGLSVLELPTDYPRPTVASGRGRRSRVVLGEELVRKMEEFNRRQGVTMYMTLLAGYQMLLGRYSHQQDIAVGTVIANRNRLETEGLIGFFVNTLVLRSRVEGRKRFEEFVGEVRGTVLAGYAHQDLPFERLVEELAPERMLGRTPLFQAMLVLQNLPEESLQLPGLELTVEESLNSTLPYDLLLTFTPTVGGGLEGLLQCSADLFAGESGERMAGHFVTLLQGLMERPEAALGTLPLLTAGERRQIEEEWNRTEEVVEGLCVQQLFEAQAERRGGAVALVCGGERLTYGELNKRANQLAHYLRAHDVGVETRVGLCCRRSVELVIGMLGILKAGGVYVPLDASYPEERLQWMVQDSGAVLVLTQEDLASHFLYVASTVALDEDWEQIGRYSGENLEVKVGPENLAYLIYTSGSTGEPKGVAVEQGSIVRLAGEKRSFQVGERDVCCLLSSVTFDASTFEIWVGLLNGAQVSIYGGFTPSLEELGSFIEREGVSTLWLTAGLFEQMVDSQLEHLGGVRQLLTGGDVVSPHHVRAVVGRWGECAVINGYGPTENTVFTTCHRMQGEVGEVGEMERTPIGKPIAGTTVYVLDEGMMTVPVGVAGELYTGGRGVARGYFWAGGGYGREVCAESVCGRGGRGFAAVPNGRSCALEPKGRVGVFRASGSAGQGKRIPDRARGDRSGVGGRGGSGAGGGGGAGRARRQTAGGVCEREEGSCAGGGRTTGAAAGAAAGVHDAGGGGGGGRDAADQQREDRPAEIAGAGVWEGRRGKPGSAYAGRRDSVRDL
jgi:aspartate racemase